MELLNTLYNLMSLVFVLGTMASMGLSLTIAQITGPLRNARFVIVALLANFVVPPILAFILIQLFSLDEPLAVGLMLVSLAAGAPGLPKTAVFAKIDAAAATGLMVLMVVLNFSDVIGLLGSGGLIASLVLVVLTTAGGYLLGKLGKAGDWIQGLGAGQRNIAAAMVVATMNFGNDEIVMVVVYSLIGMVVIIPMALELGKRAGAAAAEAKAETPAN